MLGPPPLPLYHRKKTVLTVVNYEQPFVNKWINVLLQKTNELMLKCCQLDARIRESVLANVGSIITYFTLDKREAIITDTCSMQYFTSLESKTIWTIISQLVSKMPHRDGRISRLGLSEHMHAYILALACKRLYSSPHPLKGRKVMEGVPGCTGRGTSTNRGFRPGKCPLLLQCNLVLKA